MKITDWIIATSTVAIAITTVLNFNLSLDMKDLITEVDQNKIEREKILLDLKRSTFQLEQKEIAANQEYNKAITERNEICEEFTKKEPENEFIKKFCSLYIPKPK